MFFGICPRMFDHFVGPIFILDLRMAIFVVAHFASLLLGNSFLYFFPAAKSLTFCPLLQEDMGISNFGSTTTSLQLDEAYLSSPEDDYLDKNFKPRMEELASSTDYGTIGAVENDRSAGTITILEAAVPSHRDQPDGFLFSEENNVWGEIDSSHDESLSVDLGDKDSEMLAELTSALPGLPLSRLKRIRNTFKTSLGYPSVLELVPLLRENMPDYITATWLKAMNMRNAEFVLEKAKDDEIVDSHLLNTMLEVKASAGSIDRTIEFHRDEFQKHNLVRSLVSSSSSFQGNFSHSWRTLTQQFPPSLLSVDRPLLDIVIGWYSKCFSAIDDCNEHSILNRAWKRLAGQWIWLRMDA
jgi:hypothetical protein